MHSYYNKVVHTIHTSHNKNHMITLRPYQQRIIDSTLSALAKESKKGSRHIGVYASCGSGKSILAAFMASGAAKKGNKTLVLSHRAEILKQNFSKMELLGLSASLLNAHTVKVPETIIVCAMSQTLRARLANPKYAEMYHAFMQSFDFIIVDEAHREDHSVPIAHIRKDAWVIGLTATWLRSGNQSQLGDFYSTVVAPVMPSELIALGNILRSENYIFDAPKLDGVAIDYASGDYNQKQLRERFAKAERYSGIIENYQRICPMAKAIVFTTGGEHCIELTKQFNAAGIKAKYLLSEKHPETDRLYSGERSAVIDELRHGDTKVLLSVEMLSTGFDAPEIECVILDYSTKSYTKYQQSVARGDRPYRGQHFFYVLDFGNNVSTYGRFESDPIISLWHKTGGNGVAPTKVCPEDRTDPNGKTGCDRLIPVSVMKCPFCGFEWQTENEIYNIELTKLVDEVDDISNETIAQYCARMKLKGWDNKWILKNICIKNKDNQKKAFMEAITVLRGTNGEMISPSYWWMFKKLYLEKKKKPS